MSQLSEKSYTIENLSTYDSTTPVVSIVILNLNKPNMTIECLKSLWEHTTDIAYEVIVVDNGSSPKNQKKLAAYEGPHTLLPLAINRFFGEGNNIGAEAAKGEFVLFLNNDVIVTKGWLKPLVDVFDTYPDAGCSGPKFEYPSGELQEAGALLDENGRSVQIGKFQSPNQARFNTVRSVDYVSAATVLMRRKDFMTVLGFDFRYEPAYYEDCDLCLKIGSLGKKTYYVPQSRIIHHENATTADQSNALGLGTIVELNREKFIKRWQTYLRSGQHAAPENFPTPIAAPPASATKTAAIFTPYNIIPGGGERYLLSVMKIFAEQGYALTLVAPELFSRIRITSVLEKLDLELPGLDIITYKEAEKREAFDLFYCLGNEVCPTSPALGKTNLYCCQFPFKSDPNELERRLPWLSDYDALICYSAFVESAINEKLVEHNIDDIRAQVVSPPVGLVTDVDPAVGKSGVLGIGRFFSGGHCKRQDMMVEALRSIHDQGSALTLDLVGSLHPEPEHRAYFNGCQSAAKTLPVKFHVDADPAVLAGLLQTASFYWHGAGLGVDVEKDPELCEHFGISVIEAMSARVIPMVVNNGGPSSIVEHGVSGFHYSTQEELVALTLDVASRSEQELDQLRDNAQARAHDYSFEGFRNRLVTVLNAALKVSTKR